MQSVPWTQSINFASALLLHSCTTVFMKECLNAIEILRRCLQRFLTRWDKSSKADGRQSVRTSVVLDAYTSIVSNDRDGELAELYFTNTGMVLLAISLASSVAMNILLPDLVLNILVSAIFVMAFVLSLGNNARDKTLPILALRRAGRFIWSDTPFVNFFTLIYIATVLHGKSELRLQDYVTFRSIAVLELIFMKAKLAGSSSEMQIELARRLIASEWVVSKAGTNDQYLSSPIPVAKREAMVPFQTTQRLLVMLVKTRIGFDHGCLQGPNGAASCPLPNVGQYANATDKEWKVYRLSEEVMVIADCFSQTSPKSLWLRFLTRAHGVLLRRLGKQRVIYLIRTRTAAGLSQKSLWHSNINLVTGLSQKWLDSFAETQSHESCVVAGLSSHD